MFSSVCLHFVQVEFVMIKVPRGETSNKHVLSTFSIYSRFRRMQTKQEHVESLNFVNDTVFITVMFVMFVSVL